jgi:hypothetical protein
MEITGVIDIDNLIFDYKYQMENKEKKIKIHKELINFIKNRIIEYMIDNLDFDYPRHNSFIDAERYEIYNWQKDREVCILYCLHSIGEENEKYIDSRYKESENEYWYFKYTYEEFL